MPGGQRRAEPTQANHITVTQVAYILGELGSQAATEPPDWLENPFGNELKFIYRRGFLLALTGQKEAVLGVLGGKARALPGEVTKGITMFELGGQEAVPSVERINERLGPGTASVDGLTSITPGTWCPHGEPRVPASAVQQPRFSGPANCGGAGVRVAVVDTGLVPGVAGQNWMAGVHGDPEDINGPDGYIGYFAGHGRFIASTIRSVAKDATVYVFRAFTHGVSFESDLVRELDKVLKWRPDIISLSAGAHKWPASNSPTFNAFVQNSMGSRIVLVAAAGNDGTTRKFSPAELADSRPDAVVSVGALNHTSTRLAPWSDRGPWVKVYAEGARLVQSFPAGRYEYHEGPPGQPPLYADFTGMAEWSGTSFATPLVAGMIAARMTSRTPPLTPRGAWQELHTIAMSQRLNGRPVLRPGQACMPLPYEPAGPAVSGTDG